MAEYDVHFGEKLAQVAQMVAADGLIHLDAQRTVLYLSLLSVEITLKAMLEHAGTPVSKIRGRSHHLDKLLADLGSCEIEVEVTPGCKQYVSAAQLRSQVLKVGVAETTVGEVIEAENQGASIYPNEIRYGDILQHFPANVVSQLAMVTSKFAHDHWKSIRVSV